MIKNPPIIKKIAKKMGGKIEELIPERGYFFIHIKGQDIFVSRKFKISRDLVSGGEITKFKDLTYIYLQRNDLPTPKTSCIFRQTLNIKKLEKELKTFSYPVIVKDAEGSNSKGIFSNIKDIADAKRIILKELGSFPRLIIQEMVFGREYRILILDQKAIGVLELIPPRVLGNGKNSVKDLILKKQKNTEKRTPFDNSLNKILEEQNLSLESVPEKGKTVYIRKSSSLAEGGETKDVTDIVNKEIVEICVKATRITKKYLSGIDIMCDDITISPKKQNFHIIEINGKPDIYIHYNPTFGETRNVVEEIINFIIKLNKENKDTEC